MLSSRGGVRVAATRRPASRRSATRGRAVAVVAEKEYQDLAKAEIPSHIPRPDFLKQMYRFCQVEFEEYGMNKYGFPMAIEPIDIIREEDGEEVSIGMVVTVNDYDEDGGLTQALTLELQMDDEVIDVFDTVVQDYETGEISGANRDGKEKTTTGKCFMVRRVRYPTDEKFLPVLKSMLTVIMEAVNKFYSLGSVFSEDF
mmetsp:Transcript_20021/g.65241  ORF Transcript_20021/g.65241 Transcript_20021/m.65241 type:complete len:200 (+) Transcript_20021:3-602(+)